MTTLKSKSVRRIKRGSQFFDCVFHSIDENRLQLLAFSLIEMIGVMAVVSILALALAPVFIKQLDRIAGDKETAQLKAFAEAFRQGVLKTKTIPNETGWAQLISTNLGMQ